MKWTVLICLCLSTPVFNAEYPQVRISDGILNGAFMTTRNNRKISGFTKIPYAKPPVGKLRFEAPVPNDPWVEERNATGVHAECPQNDIFAFNEIKGEEDCLYLNVYTPKLSDFENGLLPVMFWIHGGALLCGSGNLKYYGPDVLLDKDIVLVSINYRLGPLGYAATGDDVVPGNNGFKDQTMALKWVKKNIAKFGGNPDQITIFGQSAGGGSTNIHLVSPLSRGLFSRSISQSGSSMCPWLLSVNDQTIKNTHKLAKDFNCPTDSSRNMVDCLKNVDFQKIIEQAKSYVVWDYDPVIPFRPVIEPKSTKNPFLTDRPIDIIKSGEAMDVPVILGFTSNDGGFKVAGFDDKMVKEFSEQFDEIAPVSLLYYYEKDSKTLTNKIKEMYFPNKPINNSLKEIGDLFTDRWFFKCAEDFSRLRAKYYKQPVYLYMFSYKAKTSTSKLIMQRDEDYGVIHWDDLQHLFPIGPGISTESDKKMDRVMTTLWTNFAKTGNPTPEISDLIPNKWSPFTLENEEYFHIGNSVLDTTTRVFPERSEFWRSLNDPLKEIANELKDEL
ncbi:unnamed protein product [Phyllotreta striolata]|uniref:Carboxylic ester hydrolase n=1 Tax=Phyllotreta striolata TaxID=444603 RepID=A0A9N9TMC8_PHYSR|nr:unnamed protein product [Phyllotreta striolata]